MVSPHGALVPGPHLVWEGGGSWRDSGLESTGTSDRLLSLAHKALKAAGDDPRAIATITCQLVLDHLGDAAIVSLLDDDGRTLEPVSALHSDAVQQRLLQVQLLGAVIPCRASPSDTATARDLLDATAQSLITTSSIDRIDVPLGAGGQIIGILTAFREIGSKRYAFNQRCSLHALANCAGPVLEVARLRVQLRQRDRRLKAAMDDMFLAQEQDRRRVAYDIHDGLAQIAASVYQHLEALAGHHSWQENELQELEHTQTLARRTIREARRVIAQLRPTVLDDFGLAEALAEEVEDLRASGIDVTVDDATGGLRLPHVREIALFRIAQEALTNARKHAKPTAIRVSLAIVDQSIQLRVEDNGRGFDSTAQANPTGPGERVGLAGIQERLVLLGGTSRISSVPGLGTCIVVVVPLVPGEGDAFHVEDRESAVSE